MNLNKEFSRILLDKFDVGIHDVKTIWQFVLDSYSTDGRYQTTLTNTIKKCKFLKTHFDTYEFYEVMFIALVFEGLVHNKNSSDLSNKEKSFSQLLFMLDEYLSNDDLTTIRGLYHKESEQPIMDVVYNTVNLMYLNGTIDEIKHVIKALVKEKNFSSQEIGYESILSNINKQITLGVLDDPQHFDLEKNLAKLNEISLINSIYE